MRAISAFIFFVNLTLMAFLFFNAPAQPPERNFSFSTSLPANFSFFVTSSGLGHGGDLGGLAGADAFCSKLAAAAGADRKQWHAYLSAQAGESALAINARDRIGAGPWFNVKGEMIAKDLADLRSDAKLLTKKTALTERGDMVNGIGDDPVDHDILTGSKPDGSSFDSAEDRTCHNWTSSSQGSAQVGHSDRQGGPQGDLTSWNSAHRTRNCSTEGLAAGGGSGRLYCFAVVQRGSN